MNRQEAYQILAAELASYAELGCRELVPLVGRSFEHQVRGASASAYLVEVAVGRAGRAAGGILITGRIDSADPKRFERMEASVSVSDDVERSTPTVAGETTD